MTLLERIEQLESAWHLSTDLHISVSHFVMALHALNDGDMPEFHWLLWRAGLTKHRPETSGIVLPGEDGRDK